MPIRRRAVALAGAAVLGSALTIVASEAQAQETPPSDETGLVQIGTMPGPSRFLLLFFVFSLLGTPAYLAYRRRTFVGVVAG